MVRKPIPTKNIPTESPRPVGRPSTYSDDIAEIICERMINGESFVQICSDPTMPSRATLYRWRAAHPDFDTGCARAREGLADYLVDRIEQMADDTTELNVNSQKVKISVAQWRAEKMAPRIYGPRVNTEVTGNATLNVTHSTTIDVKTLDAEGRDALRRALLAAGKIIEHDENEGDA
jgi:hypothetical protein